MYPGHHAKTSPDKAAAIHASSGEVLTYADLDAHSNQLAQLLFENLHREAFCVGAARAGTRSTGVKGVYGSGQ